MLSLPPATEWLAVGDGWERYSLRLNAAEKGIRPSDLKYPHAQDVGRLAAKMQASGRTVAASEASPVYLRGSVT